MSRLCVIELAGPPRGKGRGRATIRNGHAAIYTDERTRTYEAQLRYAGQQAMAGRAPSDKPIRLTMMVAFAIPQTWSKRKRNEALSGQIWPMLTPDADNSLKLTDALNGVCWFDDKQVVIVSLMKCYSERPGLSIEVETLNDSPPAFVGESELPDILALQAGA